MRVLYTSFFVLFLLTTLSGCAGGPAETGQARVPFHIWQHKLAISLDGVAATAVADETLMVRYRDGTGLSVALLDYSEESSPEGMLLSDYMEQVYGDGEPEDPALEQARSITERDLVEKSKRVEGELTFYSLVYQDRAMAIVLDGSSNSRYLMIDSRDRSLEPILETITRR